MMRREKTVDNMSQDFSIMVGLNLKVFHIFDIFAYMYMFVTYLHLIEDLIKKAECRTVIDVDCNTL